MNSGAEEKKCRVPRQDVTESSDLHATMLPHFCGSAALIAFVIEGGLNPALNEMLIVDSEIHLLLIRSYFSGKKWA